MKYELHYAELDLKGDITCLEFTNYKHRLAKMQDIIIGSRAKVFVLVINYNADESIDSVYVFDLWNCVRFLNDKHYSQYKKMFLQEYPSYEDAYKVALDMKEVSPLCYGS